MPVNAFLVSGVHQERRRGYRHRFFEVDLSLEEALMSGAFCAAFVDLFVPICVHRRRKAMPEALGMVECRGLVAMIERLTDGEGVECPPRRLGKD